MTEWGGPIAVQWFMSQGNNLPFWESVFFRKTVNQNYSVQPHVSAQTLVEDGAFVFECPVHSADQLWTKTRLWTRPRDKPTGWLLPLLMQIKRLAQSHHHQMGQGLSQ